MNVQNGWRKYPSIWETIAISFLVATILTGIEMITNFLIFNYQIATLKLLELIGLGGFDIISIALYIESKYATLGERDLKFYLKGGLIVILMFILIFILRYVEEFIRIFG